MTNLPLEPSPAAVVDPNASAIAYHEPMALSSAHQFSVEQVSYREGETHPCFMHFHDCLEVVLFEEVSGWLLTPQGKVSLSAGSLCFSPSFAEHNYELGSGVKRWTILKLANRPSLSAGTLSNSGRTQSEHVQLEPLMFSRLKSLILWLKETDPTQASVRQRTLIQLIELSIEALLPARLQTASSHGQGSRSRLKPLMDALKAGDLSLNQKQAAERCALSESYFCRLFKKHFGEPYKQFLETFKLRRALTLLENGDSVTAIASELHFANASHFIARFKRAFGQTPGQWTGQRKPGLEERAN